jgi:SAM-dependent methyltransferase
MDESDSAELSKAVARYEEAIEPIWTDPLREAAAPKFPELTSGMCLVAEARCGAVVRDTMDGIDSSVRAVVVEPTRELLDRARDRLEDLDRQVFFASERVFSMSYADGVVNGAVCLEGIHTVSHATRAFQELARVLSDGGTVVVAAVLNTSLPEVDDLLFEGMQHHGVDAPRRRLDELGDRFASPDRIVGLADTHGFTDLDVERVSWTLSFDSGADFLQAPLIQDVWLPQWMAGIPGDARESVFAQVESSIDTYWADQPFQTDVEVGLLRGTHTD